MGLEGCDPESEAHAGGPEPPSEQLLFVADGDRVGLGVDVDYVFGVAAVAIQARPLRCPIVKYWMPGWVPRTLPAVSTTSPGVEIILSLTNLR